jgi:hypothetical protein
MIICCPIKETVSQPPSDYEGAYIERISGSHGGKNEDDMMEAASTSEKSVNFYHTTRRNNPEDSHLKLFISLYLNY